MHIDIIIILLAVGFVAGYIDAVAGGSGLLCVPLLLSIGLPIHLALGTNKFGANFGVMSSAFVFWRKNIYKLSFWIFPLIAAAFGGFIGTLCVRALETECLGKAIPIIMLIIIIYMFIPKLNNTVPRPYGYRPPKLKSGVMGIFLGFYDGFFGPGIGSFWASGLMAFFKLDLLQASAIARIMNFASSAAALTIFMLSGLVDYKIGALLAVGLISGSYLGARSAIRYGKNFIKVFFLIVVTVLAIKLFIQYWL